MGVLSEAYDGSFDGVNFMLLIPLIVPAASQIETQYHHPTTDSNTTIDLGKGMLNWEQKAAIEGVDLDAILSKIGNTATYMYFRGSTSAKLKSISTPVKAPGFDTYEFTLQLSRDN